MGKIPVQELARMMGVPKQDLVFKLKSIGVRVEGEDAHIDTDVIQAILQGKKLPQPREVILRDEQTPEAAPKRPGTTPPARRPVANPLRPARPRAVIQRVEPRIKTLPASERPLTQADLTGDAENAELEAMMTQEAAPEVAAHSTTTPAESLTDTPAPMAAAPAPAAPVIPESPPPGINMAPRPAPPRSPDQPQRGARIVSRPTTPMPSRPPGPPSRPPYGPSSRPGPGGPSSRPGGPGRPGGPPRPGGPSRPGMPPSRPGGPPPRPGATRPGPAPVMTDSAREKEREKEKKGQKRGVKKPSPGAPQLADLRSYRGTLQDIEAVDEQRDVPTGASPRRRRRAERGDTTETAAVLSFKKDKPSGPVTVTEGMTVREFSEKLGVKVRDLIKMLFERGILANINHVIDADLAQKLANELGVETLVTTFEEEVQLKRENSPTRSTGRVPRGPVVTIMGHVDHGKTSLLDAIRSSKVTESEHGGITQHIGAYHVDVGDKKIVFLDTPGHEAFTMMRARGARVTDLVVLVVAADDGVMPQTIEAIDHATAAKVPIVVAINKIDKPNANPDRVKKELADRGLLLEEWGGKTVGVPISALKRQGINELLEMILLTADLLELKADPELPGQGVVLEARKEVGRGSVATVLVQNGTLKVGDVFVSGATWGRVRAMSDDRGERLDSAGPSTPVEVTGFSEIPAAGDLFQVVEEEAKARDIVEYRRQEQRKRELAPTTGTLSLEQLFSQIQQGEMKELPVVLKADVQGSVEVLRDTLAKASTDKVKVNVIHAGVGAISTNDVLLAAASKAIIFGFSVRPERNAAELAEKENVEIRLHTVIYEMADELKKAMVGLLEPTFKEVLKGRAEVRDTFKVPKVGTIAGGHVVEGVIPRTAAVRLLRDNRVVYEGKISSLRRFKDDVSEVRNGFDCGIGLERFQDMKPGDVIEAFVKEEVAPVL